MNFDDAITAHSMWKMKLSTYLRKPDGTLNAAEIALDDKCELGKWIAAEGHKLAKLPAYASLKAGHSRFHKAASALVRRADAGENMSAEVALGANSEFGHASRSVVQAIMDMKQATLRS